MKKAKKTFMVLLATLFLFSTVYTPAMCEDKKAISKEDDSQIFLDMAVARPLGAGVTVAGAALFIVFLPFSLVSGNVQDSWYKLVVKPAEHTFKRSLGEF